MTPMKMTTKTTGKTFYGVVDREDLVVYTELGVTYFPSEYQFNFFMDFNQAEETPLEPKNFSFFRI